MFLSNGSLVTKTPISIHQSNSYFPWMPPMSTHGWPSAYAGIYSRQLWVYTVVYKLARAAARLPLPVYERNDLDRPRADDHPMARLLANPNPGMSGYDLWLWTSATFDIYGDTFWLKRRRRGEVVGLYPLHPSSMHNEDGRWRFDNGKLVLADVPDADLVRFKHFHPDSLTRGLSPLEPLRATLENEWSARTATSSFWQNGARPGMALSHPSTLSEGAQQRLKTQVDAATGGAGRTGSTLILEEGMEPKVMTLSAEEAQYIETRKLNREEVCAAYDVPPPVVHILDRATFSNITEQMRSMYRDTMAPRLKGFEAAIEIGLRQAEWPDDNIYAEFLMDDVLRGDFETRQDALAKASHMTIAEKRKVENLPFIEGTDRIFLNTATMPLDAIDAQAALIASQTPRIAPSGDSEAVADAIPLPVARVVLGRLSWQRSLSDVNLETATAGLSDADAALVGKALDAETAKGGTVADLRRRLSGMSSKTVTIKALDLDEHQAAITGVLADFFKRQPNLDPEAWDADLTADLHAVAIAVSTSIGKAAVRAMGFDPQMYDVERTIDFLEAVAERVARSINETTRTQLAEADEPAVVYANAEEVRAPGTATYLASFTAGFAVVEAGRRAAEAGKKPTKTWVAGPNPRSTHAALNGQTVPIDEPFTNGQMWPGSEGAVDEVAGCNCSVTLEV